ncbi:MAG: ATP phosphoribosyltransferase regulatory subunit [Hyphomicrobiales bacterium]|nr:ATP phosphoribosyltransferase regulatory subunit [Hyphomicrobiales bacterium]
MPHIAELQKFFAERKFSMPEIPLLQPADPFLDTVGEDLRRRIFMTHDLGGASLCLRPEFTIPVCLAHLNGTNEYGNYAYCGNVFRQRRRGPEEFYQAGMEIIGGNQGAGTPESINSDVDCVANALDALAHCGMEKGSIIFGDKAIFEALLLALELPEAWRSRLGRAFGDRQKFENDLQLFASSEHGIKSKDSELHLALEHMNRQVVTDWVVDKMVLANLPAKGGRSAVDIAKRTITKADLAATQLGAEQRRILTAFLDIEVPLADAVNELRNFSISMNLDIDHAIDIFARRAEQLIDKTGSQISTSWRANFGRPLDYYTGIVFEIFHEDSLIPTCGGGRYDHLMNLLGAENEIPAIGFSIWIDRLRGSIK